MPMAFPYIIGADLAGTVEALGPGASRFRVGDRVWGSNQGLLGRQGATAEYAAVDEDLALPDPGQPARRRGRRPGPGRDHGPPRPVPQGAAQGGRVGLRPRRQRRRRLDGRPDGQGRRGPGRDLGREPRAGRALPGPRRRPRPELQDRRHPRPAPRVRPGGDRRLVRDPARAEPRGLDPPAPPPGPDDRDRRPGRQARPARSARSTRATARCSASPCSTPRPTSSAAAPRTSTDGPRPASSGPRSAGPSPSTEAAEAHRFLEDNTIHGAGTLAGKVVIEIG